MIEPLRTALSGPDLQSLVGAWKAAYSNAPRRPHPGAFSTTPLAHVTHPVVRVWGLEIWCCEFRGLVNHGARTLLPLALALRSDAGSRGPLSGNWWNASHLKLNLVNNIKKEQESGSPGASASTPVANVTHPNPHPKV